MRDYTDGQIQAIRNQDNISYLVIWRLSWQHRAASPKSSVTLLSVNAARLAGSSDWLVYLKGDSTKKIYIQNPKFSQIDGFSEMWEITPAAVMRGSKMNV